MITTSQLDQADAQRRRFIGLTAAAVATSQTGLGRAASAQAATTEPGNAPAETPGGARPSFAPLKQVDAGALSIGYAEAGPADGPVTILLHGWPYDIHSFVDVAPLLASEGYRVIVPYLRG